MPLDSNFLKTTTKHFNPYLPDSGTEHVAMLLYSMARMTRPKIIVEYGSGYSTLFVLRALADNVNDIVQEKADLLEKTKKSLNSASLGGVELLSKIGVESLSDKKKQKLFFDWVFAGDKACQINPNFFLTPYMPKLLSIENLPDSHEYVKKMGVAVEEIGHLNLFTHLTGQEKKYNLDSLALNGDFIDWAWNDNDDYRGFFTEFWPLINPKGGLLIFHNAVSVRQWVKDIQWMVEQRSNEGDLEVLTIEEPHKLNQNGCVILRKTSKYSPSFHIEKPYEILDDIIKFMLLQ